MNQIVNNHTDESQDNIERVAVFKLPKLGVGLKNRIKSLGCQWDTITQTWLCPLSAQSEVQRVLEAASVRHFVNILPLTKGALHKNPKIAALQARIDILEEEHYKSEIQLLTDVCRFDPSRRPEDYEEPPIEDGKSAQRFAVENDFHMRILILRQQRMEIDQLKDTLKHIHTDPGEKVFEPEAPLLIADALIEAHYVINGLRTLQYCSDVFLVWNGVKYVETKPERVRQVIYGFLRDAKRLGNDGLAENFNPTKYRVDQVIDALRAVCHQSCSFADGATWLDDRTTPHPKQLIIFKNGLLNLEEWLKDAHSPLLPHTPLLLNTNALDFDFDTEAVEPREWLSFLNAIWPDDAESQQTLQEWTGYLLTQDTKQHKILLIIGPPRSGKGTIGRILHELLGAFNVAGPTLSSLSGEFGLQPLLNKLLATISDARLNSKGSNNIIIERLLSISGEDPLTINRKFLPSVTAQLPTRIIIMSNELPDMRDASGALSKRYLILTLQKSWLGKEDTGLILRLRRELPGILLWALQGLANLALRGRFIQPKSAESVIEELEALTSPITAFVSERCELEPFGITEALTLFKEWSNWCECNGYSRIGNIQSFGKSLRAAFPQLKMTRPQINLDRERSYLGICICPPPVAVRGRPRTERG